MQDLETYLDLFFNSFYSGLFFTFDKEYMVWVLNHFSGSFDLKLDYLFTALLAFLCSSAINYGFGFMSSTILLRYKKKDYKTIYSKHYKETSSNLTFCLLFLTIPVVNTLVFLFLGFLRIGFKKSIMTALFIKGCYYSFFLYLV